MSGPTKTAFKKRRIRKTRKDYMVSYVMAKKTFISFVTLTSLVLITLTSGLVTEAAPTGNPPASNITPTFSTVKTEKLLLTDDLSGDGYLAEISVRRDPASGIPILDLILGLGGPGEGKDITLEAPTVKLAGQTNKILNRVELSDTFNFEPEQITINTPNQNTSRNIGSGTIIFKSYKLNPYSLQRNRDGNVVDRFISCPSYIDMGETSDGQKLLTNGRAMACSYHASGNNIHISDEIYPAQSTINSNGSQGCDFNLEAHQLSQSQADRYGLRTNLYGKMACYYGTTPKGVLNSDIGV